MKIRDAKPEDAQAILDIFTPYILQTAISFETISPTLQEFEKRIEGIKSKYPYLVLEDGEEIVGYAYAGRFKVQAAYEHCVETTIYLKTCAQGKGYGRLLYQKLEDELRAIGIKNAYACIATTEDEDEYLNNNSVYFHEAMGYSLCGTFRKSGYKFGKYYDMIWMEKFL